MPFSKKFFPGIFLLILFFVSASSSIAQNAQVIIKLKQNAPQELLNAFKNNSIQTEKFSVTKTLGKFNAANSKQLFEKIRQSSFADNPAGLDRIFILDVSQTNSSNLISLLSKNEFVEYIELNRALKVENVSFTPNDTYYSNQYYLPLIGMESAWNISQGDSNVIVGVIDTGLDFLHPDLQNSFKLNFGETGLDALGRDKRANGIDDDGNGFIDDWRGWDFTDEPFTGDPRRGDYLTPDNDPTDDNKNSHGTAAIGIINAAFNNSLGISSVAPKCKVLVLRAFDAEGFGEEDDVANAVLYGLSQGVRIFNFSFGDYVYSNLLKDVVKFAYSKNAVIVCSAGNDGTDRLHYPSAYDEVISVAASAPDDARFSASSNGATVDIYAPGFQILTTMRKGKGSSSFNGDYDYINGTSFSAPIVTGAAALMKSLNPNLTNEEIRGILVANTTLFPNQSRWDNLYSSGRVNVLRCLQNVTFPSVARIHFPFQDYTTYGDTVPICISAASPLLQSYSLYYAIGYQGENWIPLLQNQSGQVLNDTVYRWNISSLPDTSYTLRLAINSNSGRTVEHRQVIFKDKNPPVITGVTSGSIIDKNNTSELIAFATNKRTLGKIYYKRKNINEPFSFILADIGTPNIGFITESHYGIISSSNLIPGTEYEYYIEARSLNGKSVTRSDSLFNFIAGNQINQYGFNKKNYSLFNAQSCYSIVDINGNGQKDILLNDIKNNLRLNAYAFSSGAFQKISNNNWGDYKVARDIADINNDGKLDLLISQQRNGYVYTQSSNTSMPDVLVWKDSANNNFWSSRFADVDNDGKKEILGFADKDYALKILTNTGGNNYAELTKLPYYRSGNFLSEASSQNVIVEDFFKNGYRQIIFTNSFESHTSDLPQTAISIYSSAPPGSNNDADFHRIFLDSTYRSIRADNVICGDFDGDGIKEFALGSVSNNSDLLQYYELTVYRSNGENFEAADVIDINGYKNYTETSTRAGDIDADGKDEILINTGTNFYILKYNSAKGHLEPVYYMPDINTVNQIVHDFDGNGVNEIGLNTVNDTLFFYEKNVSYTGPVTPGNISAYSIDSNQVRIEFAPVQNVSYYKIYKSSTDSNQVFTPIDSVNAPVYADGQVTNRKNYYYKISSVSTIGGYKESYLSDAQKVYVHNKPRLLSAKSENNGYVSVRLSETIQSVIPNLNSFTVNGIGSPDNIAIKNSNEYLLIYNNRFANGNYSLKAIGLRDFYFSPVDTSSVTFNVSQFDSVKFYIRNLTLIDKNKLKVEFNLPLDSASAFNKSSYSIAPFDIGISGISFDANRSTINLTLENKAPLGATGKTYILTAKNIYSSGGIKIVEGAGGSFGLIFNKEDLSEVYVYPNPWASNLGQDFVTFANLTVSANIKIYDLNGNFVSEVNETDGNGGAEWDLRDKAGNKISSGIYIFRASGKNSSGAEVEEKIGKFVVVR
ncbi:MAG: S8 family serine peptidase [Bacteroidetes bacterium]|nr:S8 family serine peptidase [Bacteroidota bacterium]